MKKLRKIFPWLPVLTLITPLIAAAQFMADPVTQFLYNLRNWVVTLIPILMAVVVIVFLWGIVKYITAAGDMEKEKDARGYIIYGLIGIAVMVGIWGLITFILNTFGIGINTSGNMPVFNIP